MAEYHQKEADTNLTRLYILVNCAYHGAIRRIAPISQVVLLMFVLQSRNALIALLLLRFIPKQESVK